jgi:hypothetical protein
MPTSFTQTCSPRLMAYVPQVDRPGKLRCAAARFAEGRDAGRFPTLRLKHRHVETECITS